MSTYDICHTYTQTVMHEHWTVDKQLIKPLQMNITINRERADTDDERAVQKNSCEDA